MERLKERPHIYRYYMLNSRNHFLSFQKLVGKRKRNPQGHVQQLPCTHFIYIYIYIYIFREREVYTYIHIIIVCVCGGTESCQTSAN